MSDTKRAAPFFVWSPRYEVDIGPHPFPTRKFRLIKEFMQKDPVIANARWLDSPAASRAELMSVHSPEYLDDLEALRWTPRTRSSELPISRPIVDAYVFAAGGTLLAARHAVEGRTAGLHVGGGFHHAFAGHAE
ncbi:MAG: histone deacetylase, partial [bacterium]